MSMSIKVMLIQQKEMRKTVSELASTVPAESRLVRRRAASRSDAMNGKTKMKNVARRCLVGIVVSNPGFFFHHQSPAAPTLLVHAAGSHGGIGLAGRQSLRLAEQDMLAQQRRMQGKHEWDHSTPVLQQPFRFLSLEEERRMQVEELRRSGKIKEKQTALVQQQQDELDCLSCFPTAPIAALLPHHVGSQGRSSSGSLLGKKRSSQQEGETRQSTAGSTVAAPAECSTTSVVNSTTTARETLAEVQLRHARNRLAYDFHTYEYGWNPVDMKASYHLDSLAAIPKYRNEDAILVQAVADVLILEGEKNSKLQADKHGLPIPFETEHLQNPLCAESSHIDGFYDIFARKNDDTTKISKTWMSLQQFFKRFWQWSKASAEAYVLALIFMQRLEKKLKMKHGNSFSTKFCGGEPVMPDFVLSERDAYSIFTAALLLATKCHDDHLHVDRYAAIAGAKREDVIKWQNVFVSMLDWDFFVSVKEFEVMKNHLLLFSRFQFSLSNQVEVSNAFLAREDVLDLAKSSSNRPAALLITDERPKSEEPTGFLSGALPAAAVVPPSVGRSSNTSSSSSDNEEVAAAIQQQRDLFAQQHSLLSVGNDIAHEYEIDHDGKKSDETTLELQQSPSFLQRLKKDGEILNFSDVEQFPALFLFLKHSIEKFIGEEEKTIFQAEQTLQSLEQDAQKCDEEPKGERQAVYNKPALAIETSRTVKSCMLMSMETLQVITAVTAWYKAVFEGAMPLLEKEFYRKENDVEVHSLAGAAKKPCSSSEQNMQTGTSDEKKPATTEPPTEMKPSTGKMGNKDGGGRTSSGPAPKKVLLPYGFEPVGDDLITAPISLADSEASTCYLPGTPNYSRKHSLLSSHASSSSFGNLDAGAEGTCGPTEGNTTTGSASNGNERRVLAVPTYNSFGNFSDGRGGAASVEPPYVGPARPPFTEERIHPVLAQHCAELQKAGFLDGDKKEESPCDLLPDEASGCKVNPSSRTAADRQAQHPESAKQQLHELESRQSNLAEIATGLALLHEQKFRYNFPTRLVRTNLGLQEVLAPSTQQEQLQQQNRRERDVSPASGDSSEETSEGRNSHSLSNHCSSSAGESSGSDKAVSNRQVASSSNGSSSTPSCFSIVPASLKPCFGWLNMLASDLKGECCGRGGNAYANGNKNHNQYGVNGVANHGLVDPRQNFSLFQPQKEPPPTFIRFTLDDDRAPLYISSSAQKRGLFRRRHFLLQ
ncbi:unnamed protein product [Amoebophrya sp. A120]|nr:unnamed protein product [Amoebophrya sp. A120]|eukprot:GSA120T00022061001.1